MALHIVLFQPEIPQNTGNIVRLCHGNRMSLHLIEPLGFSMDDRQLRRAGLDYHEYAPVQVHASWEAFLAEARPAPDRLFAFTTRGSHLIAEQRWQAGDWFIFGAETAGLPEELLGPAVHTISFAISFTLITMLHIVLGELMPKSVALIRPESVSRWVARPLMVFSKVMAPFHSDRVEVAALPASASALG